MGLAMRKGVAGLRFAVPPNAPFSQLSALPTFLAAIAFIRALKRNARWRVHLSSGGFVPLFATRIKVAPHSHQSWISLGKSNFDAFLVGAWC